MPKTLGAAKFKSECLALMDEVHETGTEVIVTKNGHPVAKLVAVHEHVPKDSHPLNFLYIGGGKIVGDITSPIVPADEYEALR